MRKILCFPSVAALVASLSMLALAILPFMGVASAASPPTDCPGSEGPPTCILVIDAPQSVATGQPFTVHVAITTDGSTLAKSDPCAKVDVNLAVSADESTTYYVAKASGAIATFSVVVTSPGVHTLTATAGTESSSCGYISDSMDFMAVDVPQGQPIAPCPDDVSCTQTTSGTGSAATLYADTGSFAASFIAFSAITGCGDAGPADPNGVLDFTYSGGDPKTIVIALRPDRVTKGIGQFNICWRSTIGFTQLGGTPAPFIGGYFTGYLPACAQSAPAPCVLYKTSGQGNAAFFGIAAAPGDPQAYPE